MDNKTTLLDTTSIIQSSVRENNLLIKDEEYRGILPFPSSDLVYNFVVFHRTDDDGLD